MWGRASARPGRAKARPTLPSVSLGETFNRDRARRPITAGETPALEVRPAFAGSRLGHYEIVAPLGAGGMGGSVAGARLAHRAGAPLPSPRGLEMQRIAKALQYPIVEERGWLTR